MTSQRISAIIPTRNASAQIGPLLDALLAQTTPLHEIILIDSGSTDRTTEIASAYPKTRIIPIDPKDFDHGGTRDRAIRESIGDLLWLLTQDALPTKNDCLQNLITPFADETVACVCGRQIAPDTFSREEQLTRAFNYPARSFTRSAVDIPNLGVKAFFLSNTNSVYRKTAYLSTGGFETPILTNEDMLIAARFLHRGWKIAYCAEAPVWHGHNESIIRRYRRYFDIGAFFAMHEAELESISPNGEGKRFAAALTHQLFREWRIGALFRFWASCLVRFTGNQDGRHYKRFSQKQINHRTQNGNFWIQYFSENHY